ncbi:flippase [Candidatus Falkowbacteria bacterium]|nr:flippase [Candidatus Falkowbacteria bacterium]
MKLATKIALNTIIQIISKIISIGLGLATIAIMTRYLSPIGFGQYTTITTFISFFAVAADLGLTLVTVQMISQPGADQNKVLSNLFSLRIFSAFGFLVIAPIIVWFLPYDHAIKIGVSIATLSFLFPALNQILVGLFQKHLRLDRVSLAEIVSRVVLLAGIMLAAWLDWGLNGILAVSVLSALISFLIHFYYSTKLASIKLNFEWRVWREIIHRSWPIGLTIVFNLIYLRADTLLLSFFKSANEVGIYGATYKVIDVLITLPFIFAGIILPILTSSWFNDRKQFDRVLQKSFDLMSIIALPLFFGTQFVSEKIMTTVAGKDFAPSGPVLNILIAAASIIFVGTMFSHAVIAVDKQRSMIRAYVFVAITSLIGYFIFIPKYSYFGAAWVTIYSELAIGLASFFVVWRTTNFLPKIKTTAKALIASVVMCLWFALTTESINLWLNLALASLIYFAFLYLIKGIDRQDLNKLFARD